MRYRYQISGVKVIDTRTGEVWHCTGIDNARFVQAMLEQRERARSLPR